MIKFFPLAILLMPILAFGQNEFYNTGADVYVQKGALIHVQGTVTNNVDTGGGTGAFTNNGILEVDGDFNAMAGTTFQPDLNAASTDRTVKFTGLGTQYIKGTGTAAFYNLVLDKQSATDTVMMQTNASVTGSLVFNTAVTYAPLYPSGVLTNTYNPSTTTGVTNNGYGGLLKTFDGVTGTEYLLDVQNADTDAIKGYPELNINGNPGTAYIVTRGTSGSANGGLQRAIGSATSYVYPIGTSLHGFNAVRFNFSSVPSGTQTVKGKFCDYQTSASQGYTGTIDVTCIGCWGNYVAPDNAGFNYYFPTDSCTGHPQWLILDGLQIKHGYWTFTSSDNTAFQYSVEAFPNNISGAVNTTLESWRMLKYDDANHMYGYDPSTQDWTSQITSQIIDTNDLMTWSLNTGCYAGSGIPGGTYKGFSEFSLDESSGGNALPVTLVNLEANPVNNTYIQVQWITALEINNQGFTVQRSLDAVNFTNIGWVPGHGNSTQENAYDYNDYNVAPGIVYYYRLVQVDNNGRQTATDVVQASLTGGNMFEIGELFPNPASEHSALSITVSQPQTIDIKLYNIIGQQITDRIYNLAAGVNEITFNAQQLTAGTYNVMLVAGGQLYSRKLVIAK